MKRKWTEHRTTRELFGKVRMINILETKLDDLKFQRVIHAQKRIELGENILNLLDEYERLLRRS